MLIGWVLPTALNLAILTTTLLPGLRKVPPFEHVWGLAEGRGALDFLTASLMLGLVLNAGQNPLYRILEGYLLWPSLAYEYGLDPRAVPNMDGDALRAALDQELRALDVGAGPGRCWWRSARCRPARLRR
ncbi:hypothetical protein OG354_01070 [Streptomyces canus]|nr:hypothetical protein [Streptomyces canus]WSD91652.1 hypothetical protein OG925_48450 [Streptomyces canus]